MKRELVAVKPGNTWDIILDISLSEGKNLTTEEETIAVLKANYSDIENAEFVIEDNEMFAIVDSMTTINPGDECKI